MEMGAGAPVHFVLISRRNNAGLPSQEKSLAMASSRESLKFEVVSGNMRRLIGSRGGKG